MRMPTHQYIDRRTGRICSERPMGDRIVNFLYSEVWENAPLVFRALTSARSSSVLGYLNFEPLLSSKLGCARRLMRQWGVDVTHCLDEPERLDTPGKLFTRKIRYWECRPMSKDPHVVVSPADSRVLIGSLEKTSALYVKGKFFDYLDLLGSDKDRWLEAFAGGDFAIFRLTPDKYHYNHTPVTGRVEDVYELDGNHHSCNPGSIVNMVTPYSKNKRAITLFDTQVAGGSGVGLVAMIEVVALMVGKIRQCYSRYKYENPVPVRPGMFLEKGRPKSLFLPGSSTVILLFQPDRIQWDRDLLKYRSLTGVSSRFTHLLGAPMVETELTVRSQIGRAAVAPAATAETYGELL
ncbi:MAG: phosphatidylserine decarboxylase [Deltaproteobacteria bacterium]|nr:phosphatidylserine decarboxylase [Deltaproteobacteria bacterium]